MRPVGACHCKQCQRATGSYFMATGVALSDLTIDDSQGALTWFRDPNGDWAERGFCNRCGSNIFWKRDNADYMAVTAGTLNEPTGLKLTTHIFVDYKGDYYDITDGLPQLPEGGL